MKIEFHPDAVNELIAAAQYYEEQQIQLGKRFLDSIDEALSFLKQNPSIWRPDHLGRRKQRVKQFPYLIIYKYEREQIDVLAIAHAKRKPGYWKARDTNE